MKINLKGKQTERQLKFSRFLSYRKLLKEKHNGSRVVLDLS